MKYRSKYKSSFADMFDPKPKPKKRIPTESKIRFRFELSIDYADKEIIEELKQHPNKSEYVRQLIRADIKNKKKGG